MQINFISRIPPPSRHLLLLLQICVIRNFIIVGVACSSDTIIQQNRQKDIKIERREKYERQREKQNFNQTILSSKSKTNN
jgi:hypothetical protein